jgi:hypothetical protein
MAEYFVSSVEKLVIFFYAIATKGKITEREAEETSKENHCQS